MSKQKEIEEMADLIGHNKYVRTSEQVACILFDAGYRKADEVRKETAKEILDKLLTIMPHGYEQVKAFVKVREEEYGVEVDE